MNKTEKYDKITGLIKFLNENACMIPCGTSEHEKGIVDGMRIVYSNLVRKIKELDEK